jgi:hypothetical protein
MQERKKVMKKLFAIKINDASGENSKFEIND